MTKKTNNKGFSLVELIIVIAIMAVLMVVLAPQLLRYVESSRLQRDNTALAEVANAIEIACADEDVIAQIPAAGVTIPVAEAADGSGNQELDIDGIATATNLAAELTDTVGASVVTTSRTYRDAATNMTITITVDAGAVEVEIQNWANDVDAATATQNF